jgi:UDP-glucose 4-epimerase
MTVLVAGGCGYIGSHVTRLLLEAGHDVVLVDDLSSGDVSRHPQVPLLQTNVANPENAVAIADFARQHDVDSIIHFAAKKKAPESIERPAWYYSQNVGGLATIIEAAELAGITKLIFSSSAAVYGDVTVNPVPEDLTCAPINPYGETKLVGEQLVRAAQKAGVLRGISLRYFNVAGNLAPELAEREALNLIPMAIEKVQSGQAPVIFGDDYPTADGTCVRDFIHVADLAAAHIAALDALTAGTNSFDVYNVGTGVGYSVSDVMAEVNALASTPLEPVTVARRAGDPAEVVGDVTRIQSELNWRAELTLADMIRSTWDAWSEFSAQAERQSAN